MHVFSRQIFFFHAFVAIAIGFYSFIFDRFKVLVSFLVMDNDGLNLVSVLATKLNITSKKTIMKAQELMRLADIRTVSVGCSPLQLTNTCQAVICLELAALFNNSPISKDVAVRLSGVRKKVYVNALQTYERILELQTNMSVRDIAIQFGCMQSVELAEQVLRCYEREMQKRLSATVCEGLDLSQPMFAAAAIYAACKRMKIRVDRRKMSEVGRAKKSTFDKLCLDMERHASQLLQRSLQNGSKRSNLFFDTLRDRLTSSSFDDDDESLAKKPKLLKGDQCTDDYETWRRGILEQTD